MGPQEALRGSGLAACRKERQGIDFYTTGRASGLQGSEFNKRNEWPPWHCLGRIRERRGPWEEARYQVRARRSGPSSSQLQATRLCGQKGAGGRDLRKMKGCSSAVAETEAEPGISLNPADPEIRPFKRCLGCDPRKCGTEAVGTEALRAKATKDPKGWVLP